MENLKEIDGFLGSAKTIKLNQEDSQPKQTYNK